ncbi:MAG: YidC/Oxa1 family membrane protein insertase [Candidatus Nanoarchaeia archaeon]
MGVSIIFLTIILRLLMYPLFQKSIKSQQELARIQPQIKEIQKKYKNNKEKQARLLMELYKEHKVNPMSGCLPILIQLPILYAFFRVLWTGLDHSSLTGLYWFIRNPGVIDPMFLGLIDLSRKSPLLAILAGLLQFIQSKMTAPQTLNQSDLGDYFDFAKIMSKQMVYMMPLLTILIAWNFPAGLPLYWITLTLFGIVQQYLTIWRTNNLQLNEKKNKIKKVNI